MSDQKIKLINQLHIYYKTPIFSEFIVWQFEDEKYGFHNLKNIEGCLNKEIYELCDKVVHLYRKKLLNQNVVEEDWIKLENEIHKFLLKNHENLMSNFDRKDTLKATSWSWFCPESRIISWSENLSHINIKHFSNSVDMDQIKFEKDKLRDLIGDWAGARINNIEDMEIEYEKKINVMLDKLNNLGGDYESI